MIKKVPITIPAQEAKTIEREVYVCDICGNENIDKQRFITCSACGRLACRQGYKKDEKRCSDYDHDEIGDYPDKFCVICWDLKYVKYIKEREAIEEERDKKIEELDNKIKEESLKTKYV